MGNPGRFLYRLASLDGGPHPVLDAPYDSLEAAESAAQRWCSGQGMASGLAERGIAVEVQTQSGVWRTVDYPLSCLRSARP
jgi:hypothetical protein